MHNSNTSSLITILPSIILFIGTCITASIALIGTFLTIIFNNKNQNKERSFQYQKERIAKLESKAEKLYLYIQNLRETLSLMRIELHHKRLGVFNKEDKEKNEEKKLAFANVMIYFSEIYEEYEKYAKVYSSYIDRYFDILKKQDITEEDAKFLNDKADEYSREETNFMEKIQSFIKLQKEKMNN